MIPDIPKLKYKNSSRFFLLAGPCVIEDEKSPFEIAERILRITEKFEIPFVFKGSYKKANRSKLDSFTGIGDEKALKVLHNISEKYDIPVVTDIHTAEEAKLQLNTLMFCKFPHFYVAKRNCCLQQGRPEKL